MSCQYETVNPTPVLALADDYLEPDCFEMFLLRVDRLKDEVVVFGQVHLGSPREPGGVDQPEGAVGLVPQGKGSDEEGVCDVQVELEVLLRLPVELPPGRGYS